MNKRKIIALASAISMMLGASPLVAVSKGPAVFTLPSTAVQVEADVFYLGQKVDPQSHRLVEGYAFVHRSAAANANANKGGGATCYSYIARGAKWKGVTESWVMNPTNSRGMNVSNIFAIESNGIAKWEDAADGTVNGISVDIFGNGSTTTDTLVADSTSPDNVNEVYFADISGTNTIAVTTVWGIFSGPASGRYLSEWDQVYDDVTFDWSAEAAGVGGKMDFDNIATHEIGHAFGMGHPSGCTEETMYAYASNGETKKRDLNSGDIAGINQLY